MKIAILHEMLVKLGGAEKVVENWTKLFPDAPIFTLIYDEKKVKKIFPKDKIHPQTFKAKSQKVYKMFKKQRFCLPFMASSIENFDFSEFDVVLCSSSGFAHGAITKPETKFIVYYHSPARYIWDWTNEYKNDLGLNSGWKKIFLRPIINSMFLKQRKWDYIASKRVDISLANSLNTRSRIWKYYKKEAEILYPPVETERFQKNSHPNPLSTERGKSSKSPSMRGKADEVSKRELERLATTPPNLPLTRGGIGQTLPLNKGELEGVGNYYLIISALTEFKKIEIAINGFNELYFEKKGGLQFNDSVSSMEGHNYNLVIIGVGNYGETLKKLVKGENIKFVGAKYGDELVELVQNSSGLIFPGEEDFGIVPIEVMSAGKPIFAYKGGGLLETNIEGITGEFFDDKNGTDFVEKFKKFDENNMNGKYLPENCVKQAKKFDKKSFEERVLELVSGS